MVSAPVQHSGRGSEVLAKMNGTFFRLRPGSFGVPPFLLHALKMNPPCLIAPFSFPAPAGPATNGARVNKSFGNLIPPFLLRAGPDFFGPAVDAAKWQIDVGSSSDKVRNAVTVI